MSLVKLYRGGLERWIIPDGSCRKISYKSMAKAKKVVKRQRKQRFAYHCDRCGYFHTSSTGKYE